MNADFRSFDSASGFVVVLDPDGRIVYWNRACSELTGYPLEEARGRRVWDFLLAPEDAEAARAAFVQVRDRGLPARFENDWVSRDGKRHRLAWSSAVIIGSDGRVDRVVASGVEITERERLERALQRSQEELRRSEAYLRAIFSHAFQFIGLLAPDGTVVEANQSALEFVDARREDVVGRPFSETPWWRGYPDLQSRLRSAIRDAAEGRFARFEATHPGASGRAATIDFSLTPVKDETGRVVLLVPEGRDITERKQAETRQQFLAEAGGILANALEYRDPLSEIAKLAVQFLADCCIVDVADDQGSVRRVEVAHSTAPRPWFAELLERVPLDRKHPHLTYSVLETKRPVLMTEVAPGELDVLAQSEEHLRALQALDPKSLMSVPLVAGGRILGALLFVSSRPERRYGPDDLRVAQELADRAALAVENARLYRIAREAIEARDQVLAIVAHDLRSPLQVALIASKTIIDACPGEGNARAARKAAEAIRRSVDRANHLIQDLLDVTRIESGGLSVERTSVPARELVAEAAETFGPAATESALRLETEIPEDLPSIPADRERILQVFSNLIGNAMKFTPAGGRIRIAARRGEQEVCFCVSDTGPGIAPEHLPHLFDRFWQARPEDRRGTGQGLPIAKGIVEAHGGRIWAESAPGRGSTFCFTVPFEHSAPFRPSPESDAAR